MLVCTYCLGKGKDCSLEVLPVVEPCKADADGDLKDAGMAEAMVSTSAVMVQTTGAEGRIVKPLSVLEAKGDHAEGVSWQHKQLEQELREASMGYTLPVAEEAVVRVLGEDLDMQEVSGASATATAAKPEAMEGVWRTVEEIVPRQG